MNFCAALCVVLSVVTTAKEYSDESLSFSNPDSDQAKPSSCVASIPVFFKTSFLSLLNYEANQWSTQLNAFEALRQIRVAQFRRRVKYRNLIN